MKIEELIRSVEKKLANNWVVDSEEIEELIFQLRDQRVFIDFIKEMIRESDRETKKLKSEVETSLNYIREHKPKDQ